MYEKPEFISVAKRENNKEREYLLVNEKQGKHVPSLVEDTFSMFDELVDVFRGTKSVADKKFLVIGFAETATAIGTSVAMALNMPCMQTTREPFHELDCLYFEEAHSHAKEQKLIKKDLEMAIAIGIEGILFVEDELTTGTTICNAVQAIRTAYPKAGLEFVALSIVNCMDEAHLERFKQEKITALYSHKYMSTDDIGAIANVVDKLDEKLAMPWEENVLNVSIDSSVDLRRLNGPKTIEKACQKFINVVLPKQMVAENILVLGSEEFMYPGLRLAEELRKKGNTVAVHATTRSPMLPSDDAGYVIQKRYQLSSLYEKNRQIYVYNLKQYDRVYIVTDAKIYNRYAINDLIAALQHEGNQKIQIAEWRIYGDKL
ncbi:MAG: phosphoribosyltransferase domain-containing protein [Bacillota bacterium]